MNVGLVVRILAGAGLDVDILVAAVGKFVVAADRFVGAVGMVVMAVDIVVVQVAEVVGLFVAVFDLKLVEFEVDGKKLHH